MCVGNFELGYMRDWDTAAQFLIPLHILALYFLHQFFKTKLHIVFSLVGIMLLQSGLWIALNASEEKSFQRFQAGESTLFMNDVVRGYYYDQIGQYYEKKKQLDSSAVYYEKSVSFLLRNTSIWTRLEAVYDTLSTSGKNSSVYKSKEMEFRKELIEKLELKKSSPDENFIFLCEELGYRYYEIKDYENAIKYWSKSFEDGKGSFSTLKDLASVQLLTWKFNDAVDAFSIYNQNINASAVTDSSAIMWEEIAKYFVELQKSGTDSLTIQNEFEKYVNLKK